ncbi:phospholipase A2, minor isoenzyme-like [Discoglossus pictus]
MRGLVLLIIGSMLVLQFPPSSADGLERHKRGLLDMIVTLWCYREKLKVPLLGINLYGCYCGTGGSGFPVDAVDKCCFLHDCCYHHSRISLQCYSKVKWQFYHFSCREAQTQCMSLTLCGRMACECDKQFAECLTQARPKTKHFFYNRKDLCPGPKDTCPAIYQNMTEVFNSTSTQQVIPAAPSRIKKSSRKALRSNWIKKIRKIQETKRKARA